MKEIIIDCDPGQDDALAILMALGATNLCVKGITVAAGNVGLDKTYKNAIKILSLADRLDIPIYKGASQPLKQKHITLENVFGESGLAGTENWPCFSVKEETKPAHTFLNDIYSQTTNVELCCLAPQTNMAQALMENSELASHIPQMTMMGGCVFPEPVHGWLGNISFDGGKTYAEYNFATDPEAVDCVFRSGVKNINLIGLDVTRRVLYNQDIDRVLRQLGKKQKLIADMLSTIGEEDRTDYASLMKNPLDPVRAIHDAVAVAYLTDATIFKAEKIPLKIDMTHTKGQTLIKEDGCIVNVIRSVNEKSFLEIMYQTLQNV